MGTGSFFMQKAMLGYRQQNAEKQNFISLKEEVTGKIVAIILDRPRFVNISLKNIKAFILIAK